MSMSKSFYISVLRNYMDYMTNKMDREGVKKKIMELVKDFDFKEKCNNANDILEEIKRGYQSLGYSIIDVGARTEKNFLVGVNQGFLYYVFEVGISWDPILDLPYIPGSALKGIIRSYMIDLCEKNRDCIESVIKLFGVPTDDESFKRLVDAKLTSDTGSEGLVIFSDAYPIECCQLLTPDVMTPHYYKGGEVVENELDVVPVPIVYLAVSSDVKFRFLVAYNEEAKDIIKEISKRILGQEDDKLIPYLYFAFSTGIGAKTSRGYGRFSITKIEPIKGEKKGRRAAKVKWGEKGGSNN
ncbi:type III-B CRISPR module RAMP protein Cmr6 [Acidianus sulfidivorans JP7]|uniref:Type III-B CRISPR module RAMP protein Cmr6 n=1 Tax=Acidianus sulfidivorans JP7 TaxID=619593 RepID=A0A2U9IPZ0_9CREN|nr:type III-B CRISPR module RAMP protein Cmr6 [Acidianus sulfidivorans]AWR98119.1 type III-B CRISPR module RAMP protein Cmr6 [Acidianus sulfidivorans JP7]